MEENAMTSGSKAAPAMVYIHVPKASGTTFTSLLSRHFGKEKIYTAISPDHFVDAVESASSDIFGKPIITGHICYSNVRYLRNSSKFYTIVREPLSRVVSEYNYVYGLGGDYRDSCGTLSEYVSRRANATLNMACQLIAGPGNEAFAFEFLCDNYNTAALKH